MSKCPEEWKWERHPEAEAFLLDCLSSFVKAVPDVKAFEEKLLAKTGSRLFDWLDHLVMAQSEKLHDRVKELGFEKGSMFEYKNEKETEKHK